jgi:N-acetylneuraminate synthase
MKKQLKPKQRVNCKGKNMNKIYIIAEAGVNHNGNLNLALDLVDIAKIAGADAVKFQTFRAERLVTKTAEKANYQKQTTDKSQNQYEMLKALELSQNDFIRLKEYCDQREIEFLSTPFDIESIYFLNDLVKRWKVPSGEITNYPYLVEIAKTGKPIILSTGMSTLLEVQQAVSLLQKCGADDIILLQCNTQYPTQYEDANLNAMMTLKDYFRLAVGYSDHTLGIEIPIAAAAMGASVIEKHFTIDKGLEGPDHRASLEPDELIRMVRCIRNVEKAFGDGKKEPSASEQKNMNIARKSIVAARDIKRGEMFTVDNLTTKRPGTGISPMEWNHVLGQKAIRDFEADELVQI